MRRFCAVCAALLLLTAVPLSSVPAHQEQAQPSTQQRYELAAVAWDEGRYIEALSDFIGVLESPDGDDFVETIALISGELFEASEVAIDGRNIRISRTVASPPTSHRGAGHADGIRGARRQP